MLIFCKRIDIEKIYILRNFKNATFYVDCFLYWVDLMLFLIQCFILSRDKQQYNHLHRLPGAAIVFLHCHYWTASVHHHSRNDHLLSRLAPVTIISIRYFSGGKYSFSYYRKYKFIFHFIYEILGWRKYHEYCKYLKNNIWHRNKISSVMGVEPTYSKQTGTNIYAAHGCGVN